MRTLAISCERKRRRLSQPHGGTIHVGSSCSVYRVIARSPRFVARNERVGRQNEPSVSSNGEFSQSVQAQTRARVRVLPSARSSARSGSADALTRKSTT